MNKLELARVEINRVDKEIAKLFQERMRAVEDVIAYKLENKLNIFDEARENEVIQRNSELLEEEKYKKYYIKFLKSMMDISKEYQREIFEKNDNQNLK